MKKVPTTCFSAFEVANSKIRERSFQKGKLLNTFGEKNISLSHERLNIHNCDCMGDKKRLLIFEPVGR